MERDWSGALVLPQVRATLRIGDKPRVLVLGGRVPEPKWLRAAARGLDVWAVDSGLDACRGAGIIPSRLIGDLDSASEEGRAWARANGIPLDRYPSEKDDTDFQLALGLSGAGNVLVTGCWGGRFDHAFSNIFSALGAREQGINTLCFADGRELLFPLWGPAELRLTFYRTPLAVSLLALTERPSGVTANGVKWSLAGASILQSAPREVSNVPLSRETFFSVMDGVLGVYVAFDC